VVKPYQAAVQQARVADRPCWGVFNASDFDRCFPDLSIASSQGRRLTRRTLAGTTPILHLHIAFLLES